MILGRGGQSVPFTGDRQAVKAALARVAGQKIVVSAFRHQIAMWEALAIHQDDDEVFRSVVMRECGADSAASTGGRSSSAAEVCPSEVSAQAPLDGCQRNRRRRAHAERAARLLRGHAPRGSAQVAGARHRRIHPRPAAAVVRRARAARCRRPDQRLCVASRASGDRWLAERCASRPAVPGWIAWRFGRASTSLRTRRAARCSTSSRRRIRRCGASSSICPAITCSASSPTRAMTAATSTSR